VGEAVCESRAARGAGGHDRLAVRGPRAATRLRDLHLAEPWESNARRGRKRAKTDREDARLLRELLGDGRLPEAWIAPEHVRVWCSLSKLRKTLIMRARRGFNASARRCFTTASSAHRHG
jgi:hypothetical protein